MQVAHYGTGEVVMHAPAATVLLPVLVPADLEVLCMELLRIDPSARPTGTEACISWLVVCVISLVACPSAWSQLWTSASG